MPSEWRESTLGDLCEFRSGSAFPTEFQGDSSGELPFIKVSDMELPANRRKIEAANNWVSRERARLLRANVHPAGATAFAKIGVALTYNRRRLLVRDTVVDNNMMSAIPYADRVDPGFFYYLLTTVDFNEVVSGTALPYLTQRDLEGMSVSVPPMPLQRAIARILGALDDKIELNRKMNETLEQMARAIFKSWFVDFLPFRHKGMVDSDLGPIPEGWHIGRVDEDFSLTMGQSPPGETYNESSEGVPFYQGRTDFGFRFPTVRVYCTAPTRMAKAGDTLVSVRAPVGSVNMASGECAVGRGVAAIRHASGSRSYTYYYMRSLEPDFARFEAEGTVFGSINKDDFHAIERPSPPRRVVEAFETAMFPIDQRIELNESESRTLAAIRDALLPKLMSGEVKVA
jgi:type I restriction enzyme S subunit